MRGYPEDHARAFDPPPITFTDAHGRALRPDGSALPGLYAVGNTAAPMTGPYYPGPGAPLGTAMVFASLAVRDLVD